MPLHTALKSPLQGLTSPLLPEVSLTSMPSLLTNMLAYWDLSEASGQRNDSHSNSYHLSDNNTVLSAAGVGAGQTSALFNRPTNEFLNYEDTQALTPGTGDWTTSVWVRLDATASSSETIMSVGYNFDSEGGMHLIASPASTGRIRCTIDDNSGNGISGLTSGGAGDIRGIWVHIIWKLDRTSDLQIVKVNNVAETWLSSGDDISTIVDIEGSPFGAR